ncbi:MAG: c-type cytochrome [Planctomycetales bacterium]|nr:c-type cytochrome [Planctomycetales bacterium]
MRSSLFAIASLLFLVGGLAGCRRTSPPTYERSDVVGALSGPDYGETEEEKAMWSDLQRQIEATLQTEVGTAVRPRPLGVEEPTEEQLSDLKHGAEIYARRCVQCHGVNGNGAGPVAAFLVPRPRDYTQGIFKFTSTPTGARPRRADLLRTLRNGVTGTAMPSFDDLADEDLQDVTDYLILLSQRGQLERRLVEIVDEEEELAEDYVSEVVGEIVADWQNANRQVVQPLTPMPEMTAETVAKGHAWFLKQACNKCHGKDGRGGSVGNVEVGQDAWGHKAAAADLTSGMFHGGGRPVDIYRRIYSGINGTPMPAFEQIFRENPDAIWHLVHFIKDLGERRRADKAPLTDQEIADIEARIDELTATTPAESDPES